MYAKPQASQRRKKSGARDGHPGGAASETHPHRSSGRSSSETPPRGGRRQCGPRTRPRIIEDIPEEITPEVTEHTIPRDDCPTCKKDVAPVVPDAMPGATLGHHLVSLTSWLHYGLGITIAQGIEILSYHLQTRLTSGGRIDAWRRLATILRASAHRWRI